MIIALNILIFTVPIKTSAVSLSLSLVSISGMLHIRLKKRTENSAMTWLKISWKISCELPSLAYLIIVESTYILPCIIILCFLFFCLFLLASAAFIQCVNSKLKHGNTCLQKVLQRNGIFLSNITSLEQTRRSCWRTHRLLHVYI